MNIHNVTEVQCVAPTPPCGDSGCVRGVMRPARGSRSDCRPAARSSGGLLRQLPGIARGASPLQARAPGRHSDEPAGDQGRTRACTPQIVGAGHPSMLGAPLRCDRRSDADRPEWMRDNTVASSNSASPTPRAIASSSCRRSRTRSQPSRRGRDTIASRTSGLACSGGMPPSCRTQDRRTRSAGNVSRLPSPSVHLTGSLT